MTRIAWILLMLVAAAIPLGAAHADSWAPPSRFDEVSADGRFRFTVIPADERNQLDYYEDELEALETGELAARQPAVGLLERRQAGDWSRVWQRRLVNRLSPTDVLIAPDGRHVATFDNWYSTGHGEDVIVIYGPDGRLISSMALADLLPPHVIAAMSSSVSSLQWSGEHSFTPDSRVLRVNFVLPDGDYPAEQTFVVPIEAATGRVLPWTAPRRRAEALACRTLSDANLPTRTALTSGGAPLTSTLSPCTVSDGSEAALSIVIGIALLTAIGVAFGAAGAGLRRH